MLTDEHEKVLMQTLGGVNDAARAGFAAVCAERLLAAVPTSVSMEIRRDLRKALDLVWDRVKGRGVGDTLIQEASESLGRLVVADDSLEPHGGSYAQQEAVAAVLYALRQLQDRAPHNAVWAARQLIDSVDRRIQAPLEAGVLTADVDAARNQNPALRSEVERQQRYLAKVIAAEGDAEAFESLRREALADPV